MPAKRRILPQPCPKCGSGYGTVQLVYFGEGLRGKRTPKRHGMMQHGTHTHDRFLIRIGHYDSNRYATALREAGVTKKPNNIIKQVLATLKDLENNPIPKQLIKLLPENPIILRGLPLSKLDIQSLIKELENKNQSLKKIRTSQRVWCSFRSFLTREFETKVESEYGRRNITFRLNPSFFERVKNEGWRINTV